jgi:hypothetical protein
MVSSFEFSQQHFACISNSTHACYMSHLSEHSWLNHSNNMKWKFQIKNFLVA